MGRISLGKKITALSQQIVRLKNQSIKDVGCIVSAPHLHVFMYFMRNPGCSEKQAAQAMQSNKTFIAKAVKKLADQALIVSKTDEKDARFRRIYPTPNAQDEMEKVQSALWRVTQIMEQGIAQDDIKQFLNALETMQNNIMNHIERRSNGNKNKRFDTR